MLALCLAVVGHVPTYGRGVENCVAITKDYKISQAVYLKSTGGIEIHCSAEDCPFSFDEQLDFDAVFRDQVDLSTFSIHVGCGGCVGSVDPIVVAPFETVAWQPAVIEPFTQHRYSSIFPKAVRKFNTSAIHPDVCDQGHWTLRLVDHHNRTDSSELVWGAVIGLGESFTFEELMLFPVYTLRNHGATWNGQGWTWWASLFLFAPLLIVLFRGLLRGCGVSVLESMPLTMKVVDGKPVAYWRPENPRAGLYEVAVIAFIAVMLEEFIHLNIAAQGTSASDYGYWVGLLGPILFANGLPLWQVLTAWAAMEYIKTEPDNDGCWARFRHTYWTCSASPLWWPIEFATGFSYFLLFGAGFYLGPIMICLAALMRSVEVRNRRKPKTPRTRYRVTFTPMPPDNTSTGETGESAALLEEASQRPALFFAA